MKTNIIKIMLTLLLLAGVAVSYAPEKGLQLTMGTNLRAYNFPEGWWSNDDGFCLGCTNMDNGLTDGIGVTVTGGGGKGGTGGGDSGDSGEESDGGYNGDYNGGESSYGGDGSSGGTTTHPGTPPTASGYPPYEVLNAARVKLRLTLANLAIQLKETEIGKVVKDLWDKGKIPDYFTNAGALGINPYACICSPGQIELLFNPYYVNAAEPDALKIAVLHEMYHIYRFQTLPYPPVPENFGAMTAEQGQAILDNLGRIDHEAMVNDPNYMVLLKQVFPGLTDDQYEALIYTGIIKDIPSPKAQDLFRNDRMIDENWAHIEKLLNKIMQDCVGNALYNGLLEKLKGSKLAIEFVPGRTSAFRLAESKIMIGIDIMNESNILFHEMFHAYQAYAEVPDTYWNSLLNGEFEAHYVQYLYVKDLPEYRPGSYWYDIYNRTVRGRAIRHLELFVDSKGRLLQDEASFASYLFSLSQPNSDFRRGGYENYPYNYDRPAGSNFNNLKTLSKDC